MNICLCHRIEPEASSMSKQANFHKRILKQKGYLVKEIPTKKKILTPFRLNSFIRMTNILSKSDIIHAHACSNIGFLPAIYAVIASKITRKKVIITYHGGVLIIFSRNIVKSLVPF